MGTVTLFEKRIQEPSLGQWPDNEAELWDLIMTITTLVKVELEYRNGEFECEVFYKNSNGSSIFAKAHNPNRIIAMQDALTEVARLW